MTDTTPRFALPFPEDADAPDGPAQFEALALALEERLGYAGAQAKKCVVTAEQSRTNTAYGLLGTPDQVDDIEIKADGDLLAIVYSAIWRSSVNGVGRAAIFLQGNQLKARVGKGGAAGVTGVSEAPSYSTYNNVLMTAGAAGLATIRTGATGTSDDDTANGQTVGMVSGAAVDAAVNIGAESVSLASNIAMPQLCLVRLAAGTYDVSVQFKAASGSVTARDRRLMAWTIEAA